MGNVKGPDYYNKRMDRVALPLEESPWKEVYEAAASLLPEDKERTKIADIGCGTGRFAKLISQKGYRQYWGVDFSDARVHNARKYVPELLFSVGNIFDDWVKEKLQEFNVFVVLEVLEHISDDLAVFSVIPKGSHIIFSVPNYDSDAHVRYFISADDALERYEMLIDFKLGTHVIIPRKRPGRFIYLFSGMKK